MRPYREVPVKFEAHPESGPIRKKRLWGMPTIDPPPPKLYPWVGPESWAPKAENPFWKAQKLDNHSLGKSYQYTLSWTKMKEVLDGMENGDMVSVDLETGNILPAKANDGK